MNLNVFTGECDDLRKPSVPIVGVDVDTLKFATDLLETVHANHMASLSAPQCGRHIRMFVTDIQGETEVWINPEVTECCGEQDSVESCASFPNVNLEVVRPAEVTVRTIGLDGYAVTRHVSGLLARLVMHEVDHLNGILLHDHVKEEDLIAQMLNIQEGLEPSDEESDDPSNDRSNDEDAIAGHFEDEELMQVLDVLADGAWKIALASELLKDYELDDEEQVHLTDLERLEASLAESLAYWENQFGINETY